MPRMLPPRRRRAPWTRQRRTRRLLFKGGRPYMAGERRRRHIRFIIIDLSGRRLRSRDFLFSRGRCGIPPGRGCDSSTGTSPSCGRRLQRTGPDQALATSDHSPTTARGSCSCRTLRPGPFLALLLLLLELLRRAPSMRRRRRRSTSGSARIPPR